MKEKTLHELYVDRQRLIAAKNATNNLLLIMAINERIAIVESDIAEHEAIMAIRGIERSI